MKDEFDVCADVISLINVPIIMDEIDGETFADDRPSGRSTVDIVVNCLGITNTQTQQGSGNVNIYAPNLSSGRPDRVLLRKLSKLVTPVLDGQHKETFNVRVTDGGKVFQDTDGSHFINIPFSYRSIQTNFKHI